MVYGAALEKRSPVNPERGFESHPLRGEVLEWSNRHAWRACVGFTRPWVRIPPSPPACAKAMAGKPDSGSDSSFRIATHNFSASFMNRCTISGI